MANLNQQPHKISKPIMTKCELTDCFYHEGNATGYKDYTLCSHPHKHRHPLGACPLYRLDWVKKLEAFQKK